MTTIVKMRNFYIFFGLIIFSALFSSINSEISDNSISKGYDQEIHQTPEENTSREAKGRQTYSKQIKVRKSHKQFFLTSILQKNKRNNLSDSALRCRK